MADQDFDVAIIGLGFSGVMVLAHVVEKAQKPLSIVIFDPSPHVVVGPAYATQRLEHLLNVRAGRMSAYPSQSDDFYDWCMGEEGKQAAENIGFKSPISKETFVPRTMYGAYLRSIYQRITEEAAQKHITLTHVTQRVIDVSTDHIISTENTSCKAEHIVIASGFAFQNKFGDHVIREPWHFDFERLRNRTETVALIGTGLTAVDTIMSLLHAGFQGQIMAISGSAQCPQPHAISATHAEITLPPFPEKRTLATMLAYVRNASKSHDWRHVLDALRPQTVEIWQRFSPKMQQRFLVRYFSLWNIHRHRMAPEIHDALQSALASGQVVLKQGRALQVDADGIEIAYRNKREHIACAYVFDCTGPTYTALPVFLQPLIQGNRIRTHVSGVGLSSDKQGKISTDNTSIYAIGSLLLGERLETTAVPELREQAKKVANAILNL